jgi:hypothetical protein
MPRPLRSPCPRCVGPLAALFVTAPRDAFTAVMREHSRICPWENAALPCTSPFVGSSVPIQPARAEYLPNNCTI